MKIKFDKAIYEEEYLVNKYSKYADEEYKSEGIPFVNFPFNVEEVGTKNKYLSWILIDHDSNPVVNFSWIHWLVANYELDSSFVSIPELLYKAEKQYTRGNNSFSCPLANVSDKKVYLNYGGPTPPDKDHVYTLKVYAHPQKLDVSDGFFYNELITELEKSSFEVASAKILARK